MENESQDYERVMPTLDLEQAVREELGVNYLAGVDEAGRGAVAGPVVAAAVILPLDAPERLQHLDGVNDSKQITAQKRASLYSLIVEHAVAYGIGSTAAADIDEMGIVAANAQAMKAALRQLDPAGEFLLIDGRMRLKGIALPQRAVIRGDSLSLTIAAASILAKVARDRHMIDQDDHFPQYGFARHKGYCTAQHVAALEEHGPCSIHRHSFAPIRRGLL